MVGGNGDIEKTSNRLGLPVELVMESERFNRSDEGVYPDNVQAVSIFCDMMTQWRVGMSGATGLDYKALPVVLSIRRVKLPEREDVFDCLRVMEQAALEERRQKD